MMNSQRILLCEMLMLKQLPVHQLPIVLRMGKLQYSEKHLEWMLFKFVFQDSGLVISSSHISIICTCNGVLWQNKDWKQGGIVINLLSLDGKDGLKIHLLGRPFKFASWSLELHDAYTYQKYNWYAHEKKCIKIYIHVRLVPGSMYRRGNNALGLEMIDR